MKFEGVYKIQIPKVLNRLTSEKFNFKPLLEPDKFVLTLHGNGNYHRLFNPDKYKSGKVSSSTTFVCALDFSLISIMLFSLDGKVLARSPSKFGSRVGNLYLKEYQIHKTTAIISTIMNMLVFRVKMFVRKKHLVVHYPTAFRLGLQLK